MVLPEAAFDVGDSGSFDAHWGEISGRNRIYVVVAYHDSQNPGNRLGVYGPDGGRVATYTKTHLVPFAEPYPAGDGAVVQFDVDGVRVGVLICQDDNFSDLWHAHALTGTQLMVVPVFEGPPEVAPYHYRNSLLRTLEEPMALVRAATDGTSAVIAPGARVVAFRNHPTQGTGVVIANVPYDSAIPFSTKSSSTHGCAN